MLIAKSFSPGSVKWLTQAIIISLFTDKRATVDMDAGDILQGHWGDMFVPGNESLGSHLYMLKRRTLTKELLLEAKDYCLQALQWLLEESWLNNVQVQCERLGKDKILIKLTSQLPKNGQRNANGDLALVEMFNWAIQLEYSIASNEWRL